MHYQTAQEVLRALIWFGLPEGKRPNWYALATRDNVAVESALLRAGAKRGLKEGFVKFVVVQKPDAMPSFLAGGE